MTAVDTYDVRIGYEHVDTVERAAMQTPASEGFVQRGELWPEGRGEIRTFECVTDDGTPGEVWRVWDLFERSHGGTLTLTHTPLDGSGACEVAFAETPVVESVTRESHRIRVLLEEVL